MIVPMSAMKACFHIAERRLSYTMIVPVNAMKACFHIAERSLSYTKLVKNAETLEPFL